MFGGEHDHDVSGEVDHHLGGMEIFSLRTLTYFLFAFGGVGLGLSVAATGLWSWLIFGAAAVSGAAIAGVSASVFGYLKRSGSGDRSGDSSFVGLTGKVMVPFSSSGLGKVQVQRGARTIELAARPLESGDIPPHEWKSVVVVEMRGSTALVAPVDASLAES
jgi:membrane protein implicated in regulation of membrane protease activity